ncbi:MAG: hypothetical protein ACKV2U_34165 [Bryobacteraceae bacterium]
MPNWRNPADGAIANGVIDSITGRFFLLAGFPYMGRTGDEDFGVGFPQLCRG